MNARDKMFGDIFGKAMEAGMAAGEAAVPVPMRVVERKNPFDKNSAITHDYGTYADGVCGFAWVTVRDGRSAFCKWLVENGKARKDTYAGGVCIRIGAFNQSMERKAACAGAIAKVLMENADALRIKSAYSDSRMD